MKPATVLADLRRLMSHEELEAMARSSGALVRVRRLHPVMMLEAMLATTANSGGRLADALRYLELTHGISVNRSSFYKRLDVQFGSFVHDVMTKVMESRTVAEHPELEGRLSGLSDLWAYDSSTVSLRRALAAVFAVGAESERAGVKLHAGFSLRTNAVIRPHITASKTSDERGIDLGRDLEDVLVLLDRGYSRHRLFDTIESDGGFYLTRLKSSTNPVVTQTHQGSASARDVQGVTLDEALESQALSMDRIIDIDVELSLGPRGSLRSRVVGVPVVEDAGEEKVWWYLTNLPRAGYPPEMLRELYRLRWQVELLWKTLKGRFRLDDVEALTEHNVRLIMESAVLSYFLSLGVLDATTTATERKKLTVGRMALLFPFAVSHLARLLTLDDEDEALELARKIRVAVLHGATDTNPKRTRAKLAKRQQALGATKSAENGGRTC
jgi:putative transposase